MKVCPLPASRVFIVKDGQLFPWTPPPSIEMPMARDGAVLDYGEKPVTGRPVNKSRAGPVRVCGKFGKKERARIAAALEKMKAAKK